MASKNKMILETEYFAAKKIVDAYELQCQQAKTSVGQLTIDQPVRCTEFNWDCWVTEIRGNDVLLRFTLAEDDPEYDDQLVNIASIYLPSK